MLALVRMDSIYIQIINIHKFQKYFNKFYSSNNIILIPVEDVNDKLCINRATTTDNTRLTLFYSIHTGDILGNRYTTFKFAGLVTYNIQKDMNRLNTLFKFIDFITSLNIIYRITTIDIAYDMKVDDKKSIENILPIRIGTTSNVNNPFNYFDSTLYVESDKVIKPSVRAYLYDKSVKENLDNNIIRFEVSIRNVKNADNDFESVVMHIINSLENYKLYYFDSKAKCNKIKRKYRDNIEKVNRKNLPATLKKEIKVLGGQEIELKLSDNVLNIIKMVFTKKDELITVERKIPQWLTSIPSKKQALQNKLSKLKIYVESNTMGIVFIMFSLIPKGLINRYRGIQKITVLQLHKKFIPLLVNPLLLRAFLPINKDPPIVNQHLYPY